MAIAPAAARAERGQLVEFLFSVPDNWRRLGNRPLPKYRFEIGPEGLPTIRLFPGVAELLSRLGSVLRPAVELELVRHVMDMNSLQPTPEENLRRHLFPDAERARLPEAIRGGLRELQANRCFWCRERLREAGVLDHVTPWVVYRNDALENLVLVDKRCNQSKSDWLIGPASVMRYLRHLVDHRSVLLEIGSAAGWLNDELGTLGILHSVFALRAEAGDPCLGAAFLV